MNCQYVKMGSTRLSALLTQGMIARQTHGDLLRNALTEFFVLLTVPDYFAIKHFRALKALNTQPMNTY
jgi:hypothetical protein